MEPASATSMFDPLWLKALHVIAVLAWMAGLMMLPRLYAYQTGSDPGGELDQKMMVGAKRLRGIILTPAMVLTWIFGLALLSQNNWALLQQGGWMHAKLALVVLLSGYHGYLVSAGKALANGQRRHSERFWRLFNEVPFLMAIAIVILVIVKPF